MQKRMGVNNAGNDKDRDGDPFGGWKMKQRGKDLGHQGSRQGEGGRRSRQQGKQGQKIDQLPGEPVYLIA